VIQCYYWGYVGYDNYQQARQLFAAFLVSASVHGVPAPVQHTASDGFVCSRDGGLPPCDAYSSSSDDSQKPQQEEDSVVSKNGEIVTPGDGQSSSVPDNSSPQQQQEVNVAPEYQDIVFPDRIDDGNEDYMYIEDTSNDMNEELHVADEEMEMDDATNASSAIVDGGMKMM
jgi:hypothetical protein